MLLFCMKTVMIVTCNFEIAHLKKEEEAENILPFGGFMVQLMWSLKLLPDIANTGKV